MAVTMTRTEDGKVCWIIGRRPPSLHRRSVERRVQHRLYPEGFLLRKCSPRSRWHPQLGDYYLVSMVTNTVHTTHQDLEDLAREYGVLREGQAIAGD
jgi:hypothetical protein